MSTSRLPTYFISHGGGPWPWIKDLMPVDWSKLEASLLAWDQAPSARASHPSEDHLIPLMVAAGAAEQDPAVRCYYETEFFGSVTAASYRFG
jgi:aromatic ring-opening dioxygenase catalytic subunit (LigB family)